MACSEFVVTVITKCEAVDTSGDDVCACSPGLWSGDISKRGDADSSAEADCFADCVTRNVPIPGVCLTCVFSGCKAEAIYIVLSALE